MNCRLRYETISFASKEDWLLRILAVLSRSDFSELSDLEWKRCRREAFAYQTLFGQSALIVTITPKVVNWFVMAQYTGVTSVHNIFAFLESTLPSKSELCKAVMEDGSASA
ncbi:hypothetical protein PHMEG_00016686 [Phytophthora megakarya]|uniref:Uncharacterized protein n=1 Tax=Phytophthora megakarya TaxID=4795 RepID=A0A225VZA8_9STRA|nr:hypothetical protein PHMEG_00016686 [Phytophthora megakarya]